MSRSMPARERWLPDVPPEVARRRRVFFASVGTLVVLAALSPALLASRPPARPSATVTVGSGASTAVATRTGCTLQVGADQLPLTDALARSLTDAAGRAQKQARPVSATAVQAARLWPALASRAPAVAASLRGYVPGALACTATTPAAVRQGLGPDGLTPRAHAVWLAVEKVFGRLPAGGFLPGGVHTGHVVGSAHYEGRAIDYFYRPVTAKTLRHGWVLAQWLVAHAQELDVATVIFDRRIWVPGSWDARTWQPYYYPDGPTENPTLLHYDHVHVDVVRGTAPPG